MTTLREIRAELAAAWRETQFFPKANETYYPAHWTHGRGAGDASTSCPGDREIAVAAEHVARKLGLVNVDSNFDEFPRQRDAAARIARLLREQHERDRTEDGEQGAEIATVDDANARAIEFGEIRKRLELTQTDFASRLGVSSNQISRIERGESAVSEPVLRLARTFKPERA